MSGESSSSDIANISRLIEGWSSKLGEVRALEARIEELQKEIRVITNQVLPDLMLSNNLRVFEMADGRKVTVGTHYSATWPKDPIVAAAVSRHIQDLGYGDVISVGVTAEFVKGHVEAARQLYESLATRNDAKVALKESVHYQTLQRVIRECVEGAKPIDMNLLNVHVETTATLKEPKNVV